MNGMHTTTRFAAVRELASSTLIIFLCFVSVSAVGGAQKGTGAEPKTPYRIPRTDSPIAVDGVLDETAWQDARVMELRYETEPGENVPPPARTEVLVTYDQRHLYVGIRAYDPEPSAIRAHLTDRDGAWADDNAGVLLDTFNDERRCYTLAINPRGVQMDMIVGGGIHEEWDGIWDSAARITNWGWTGEMRIPFSSLRFQWGKGDQVWGFDASRFWPRRELHLMGTSPRDRSNNCVLCQVNKIVGFAGVTSGQNLEIVPTVTAVRTDVRNDFPTGSLESGDEEIEAGVTARWGITPNLTLGATLNPDFSQVEADTLQLDGNEPFLLFYPEKRPFFMEASDFFRSPLNVLYTRSIRDPVWGLSYTGKQWGDTIGVFVVQDEVTNLVIPGNQRSTGTSLALQSTASVVRYKRDIGNRFTLGALFTNRDADDYRNWVTGLDSDLRFGPKDRLKVQLLGSRTEYPDAIAEQFAQPVGDFIGWAADLYYSHETRSLSYWGGYRDVNADFRADLGFMPRVGFRSFLSGTSYTWNPGRSTWYSKLDLAGQYTHELDQNGELLNREAMLRFTYDGPLQTNSFIEVKSIREAYNCLEFDQKHLFFHYATRPSRHSHLWLNAILDDHIDYVNTQLGDRIRLEPGIDYRMGRHLRVLANHTFEQMEVEPGELYTANISQLTVAFYFNARSFLRAIAQNINYEYNVDLYNDGRDPEFKHLFTQLLFSYKVNPRTVFFLGYSDNHLANQDFELTQRDRTIFAKVGYAWTL